MGCGNSSNIPPIDEPDHLMTSTAAEVVRVKIDMTYDTDDSDNETTSPNPALKKKRAVKKSNNNVPNAECGTNTEDQGRTSKSDDELMLDDINVTPKTPVTQSDSIDSDISSDESDVAEHEDSDDDGTDDVDDEVLVPSLKAMLVCSSRSWSMDIDDENDEDVGGDDGDDVFDVEAHNDSVKGQLKELLMLPSRSSSGDGGDHDSIIQKSLSHMMSFRSTRTLSSSPDKKSPTHIQTDSNPSTKPKQLKGTQSIKKRSLRSQSFVASSEDIEDVDVGLGMEAMEVSLRGMLSFRSSALSLREDAKKFRNELKKMKFGNIDDKDHPNHYCKYTCTYILYKIKKIIAINSILSKFANDNAINFLNPFQDHTELTATLNIHLRKLLACIKRTKMDKITINGPCSRAAAEGLMSIFQLIGELNPSTTAIDDKVKAIQVKIAAHDDVCNGSTQS